MNAPMSARSGRRLVRRKRLCSEISLQFDTRPGAESFLDDICNLADWSASVPLAATATETVALQSIGVEVLSQLLFKSDHYIDSRFLCVRSLADFNVGASADPRPLCLRANEIPQRSLAKLVHVRFIKDGIRAQGPL